MVTELPLDNPWFKLAASPRMLDVVNSYLEMWSKLLYVDQWYTIPVMTDEDARFSSQRWHRDYNDQHLIKVFIYMNDVDEGAGPFEYVPGSARGGPYADAWPWVPFGGDLYPPPEEFDQKIPAEAVRTLTGPAGSVIFCNTSGFHRGGFATEAAADHGCLQLHLAGCDGIAVPPQLQRRGVAAGSGHARVSQVRARLRHRSHSPTT